MLGRFRIKEEIVESCPTCRIGKLKESGACNTCNFGHGKTTATATVEREPVYTSTSTSSYGNVYETPWLTKVFYVLSVVSLLGGIILFFQFLPGAPEPGYTWKTAAYTSSIVWITAGIVEAALFAAFGQGLAYLHRITQNTARSSGK